MEDYEEKVSISLPVDSEGYLGRVCPNNQCKMYFKIHPESASDNETCTCPYCGNKAHNNDYATDDQSETGNSLIFEQINDLLEKELKNMEFDIKPKGDFGLGVSLKVKSGPPIPLHHYQEKQLETKIECSKCGLKYTVYGVFAFCPDCGQHNSLQILNRSLEVVQKLLTISEDAEPEIANKMIENALEDCVSAFDGFGRELFKVSAKKASDEEKAKKVSFQNILGMQRKAIELFGIDPQNSLTRNEWDSTVMIFQKRHLLSHKMGVVDEEYIQKSQDRTARIRRKIKVSKEEVNSLCENLSKLAEYLSSEIAKLS
ncbi:MAG: hypothetical protein J7M10_06420 [Candidatus Cloacimonetes bacterium]|nr:hypothetical protein [Candidatus Cloacimonadota bacterium]